MCHYQGTPVPQHTALCVNGLNGEQIAQHTHVTYMRVTDRKRNKKLKCLPLAFIAICTNLTYNRMARSPNLHKYAATFTNSFSVAGIAYAVLGYPFHWHIYACSWQCNIRTTNGCSDWCSMNRSRYLMNTKLGNRFTAIRDIQNSPEYMCTVARSPFRHRIDTWVYCRNIKRGLDKR